MGTNGDYVSLVAKQLTETLEAVQCTIRIPNGETLELAAAYGIEVERRERRISFRGTLAGESFSHGEVISIPDITKDERYRLSQLAMNGNPKSVLAIPIKFEDDLVGVAQVYARMPFSDKQIFLAKNLSELAGLALNHEQTLKMKRRALLQVTNAIARDTTFLDTFRHLVKEIAGILQISRCTIYKIEETENQEKWCEIVAGMPADDKAHGIGRRDRLDDHPDILAATKDNSVRVIKNPKADPLTSYFKGIIENYQINQILYVPVNFNRKIIGIIVIDASGGEKLGFTREEMFCCSEIAEHIALLLYRDNCIHQEIRHEVMSKIVCMHGYSKRIIRDLEANDAAAAKKDASKVMEEAEKMEAVIPKIKNLV